MADSIVENKLVSVIMPAYNAEKYIGEAIESVLSQVYQNWELVIVNDASQDNTLKIIEYYTAMDSRIKVYSFSYNQGACAALNEALKRTNGEYICWLSADDKYKKEMLSSSLSFLNEHKNFQAVFSKHEFINEVSELLIVWEPHPTFMNIGKNGCVEPYYSLVFGGNAFNACTVLATAESFSKAGFFDEKHRYAGDYHYMMKMAAYADFGFLNQINVQSRIHPAQVTNEGNNETDAILAYADIVFYNDVRKRLYQKAGIKDGRENVLHTFKSREILYKNIDHIRETIQAEVCRFLNDYPLIVEANEYCNKISEYMNEEDWNRAKEMLQTIPAELKAFTNKEIWGILMANLLDHMGKYTEEKEVLKSILKANSSNYEAYYMYGNICEKTDNDIEALENYMLSVLNSTTTEEDFKILVENLKRFINQKF